MMGTLSAEGQYRCSAAHCSPLLVMGGKGDPVDVLAAWEHGVMRPDCTVTAAVRTYSERLPKLALAPLQLCLCRVGVGM